MRFIGLRICYRGAGAGTFHCQRCGGDRPYRRRSGRHWFHVLRIPIVPLGKTGEHLRCAICRTCYRVELLAVPTTTQMQSALLAATTVAALAMLEAGDAANPAARRKAADLIRSAGSRDYGRVSLAADVDGSVPARNTSEAPSTTQAGSLASDLEPTLGALALQLEVYAREWFLANVVRIGLADGPLSASERQVVRTVAGFLGMTQAQAEDVIWLTEEAAQAG
jgi:Tellurite resistance protein TerB